MNQEIPRPLRNALSRQEAADVHPSPDVLTSFMERTLPALESEVVVHHLAQCVECREIVFLASAAAEDEVRGFVAVAAPSRVPAMPVYADAASPATLRPDVPRSTRKSWVRWGAPIAAVVMLVCAVLVLQFSRGRKYSPAPLTVASNRPVSAIPETQQTTAATDLQLHSTEPSAPPTLTKDAPHGVTTAARAGKVSPSSSIVAPNYADKLQAAPAMGATPPAATAPQPSRDAVASASSALVPQIHPQNSFAENETTPAFLQPSAPLAFGKARVGLHAVSTATPQWRIDPQGHLERSSVPDQWTHVLDDQPVSFRAVAAMGDDIWAGGNGGALFHSADRGEHWSKVSLTANSNVETGAIVSIHFDDTQHGTVTSAGGTRWATTDGGLTWLTQ